MNNLKEKLINEVELKIRLGNEGIRFSEDFFKEELAKNKHIALLHLTSDFSLDDTSKQDIPNGGRLDNGIGIAFNKNSKSSYYLDREDGVILLKKDGKTLSAVTLVEPPKYYEKNTSDGVPLKTIGTAGHGPKYGESAVRIAYSNECSLIDTGKDCLFCNINTTHKRFAGREGVQWKHPKQIAETMKEAQKDGYDHFTITGGYVPERREVEYYLDSAEQIREVTGQKTFNVTAVIGAPLDLTVIEKYKEAGFESMAFNTEVWGKDFFRAICPGKVDVCGGYDNWLDAIYYAVQVFGRGHVRSNFVSGLQPKSQLLEGIETLAGKGVVATASQWVPNIGSALEGHKSPGWEWHYDVYWKNFQILKSNGITFKELYDSTAGNTCIHDFYKIDDGTFYTLQQEKKEA